MLRFSQVPSADTVAVVGRQYVPLRYWLQYYAVPINGRRLRQFVDEVTNIGTSKSDVAVNVVTMPGIGLACTAQHIAAASDPSRIAKVQSSQCSEFECNTELIQRCHWFRTLPGVPQLSRSSARAPNPTIGLGVRVAVCGNSLRAF